MTSKKKVIIGLSGGVDSAIAAALLKKDGYDVTGVFLNLTDKSKKDQILAKKIAKILEIPFLNIDLKKEFKKKVIDHFIDEYSKGVTPNPCVVCNKEIKFGLLFEKTKADHFATGHYAKIKKENGKFKLLKGKDKGKDQSYFLWTLTQKKLKRILFPLQNHTKDEVRELAQKLGISKLIRSESQEVCFIPDNTADFLKKHILLKPGDIIGVDNRIIGEHQGLPLYTIGQRKMIGLSGGPYYVLSKNLKKNQLVVTKNEQDLRRKKILVKNINWISGEKPKFPLKIKARIRYRSQLFSATIRQSEITFARAQKAITPGQSVVFYNNNELLGGGIIFG